MTPNIKPLPLDLEQSLVRSHLKNWRPKMDDAEFVAMTCRFDGITTSSVTAAMLRRVSEIVEEDVKRLCDGSQAPGDFRDVQAMALGSLGDRLNALADHYSRKGEPTDQAS